MMPDEALDTTMVPPGLSRSGTALTEAVTVPDEVPRRCLLKGVTCIEDLHDLARRRVPRA